MKVKKLSARLLKVRAEARDKLVHASSLLVRSEEVACMSVRKRMSSHHRVHCRRKSINLAPDSTITTAELSNGVIPLLKPTKSLVKSVELRLAVSTVVTGQIVPRILSSGQLCNLRVNLKDNRLTDHHLRVRIINVPLLKFFLISFKSNLRD